MHFATFWSYCSSSIMLYCSQYKYLWKWRNKNSKYEPLKPMVPPKINFWSNSRKERPASQQKQQAQNRVFASAAVFKCSNDKFNRDRNGKSSLQGVHPFLTKLVLIMNSCFIQYNAPLQKQANVVPMEKFVLQERLVISQLQINFINFEVQIISVPVHDNFLLYQSWKLNILFVCQYILSNLGGKLPPWNQSFHCLLDNAIEVSVSVFWEKFLESKVHHDKVPNMILAGERSLYYLQCSNSSWLLSEKSKVKRVNR